MDLYSRGGLLVASDLPLPECRTAELSRRSKPDVVIRMRDVIDQLASDRRTFTVRAGECRLSLPGVGILEIRNGCEISVQPLRDVSQLRLRAWLMGAAWAALCYQRGILLVHASAILVNRRAVLFCAPAGGGKSTIAAVFSRRRFPLIADDLCHIEIPGEGEPIIHPSAPGLRLWSDALATLEWDMRVTEPDQIRPGKFRVTVAEDGLQAPIPLGAIYLLTWGDFSIARMLGFTAWRRFLSGATYRPRLFDSIIRMDRYFERSIAVLQQIPIWELRRPRDLGKNDEIADQIIRHWAESLIIG